MNKKLLFVDDEQFVLDSLKRTLHAHRDTWNMTFCACPKKALNLIDEDNFDLVVSDIGMPLINGLQLLERLQQSDRTRNIPVVIVTGQNEKALKSKALEMGATDLLSKPVEVADLIARIRGALRLKDYQDQLQAQNELLERKVMERTAQLTESRLNIIWRLAKAAEYRDEDTGNHVIRVGCYSRAIAETMGLDKQTVERLFITAPLHDIGKIGVPDSILLKPGKLTEPEWHIMRQHCEIGARILQEQSKALPLLQSWQGIDQPVFRPSEDALVDMAASIALCHHEKWDGSGYPRRLAGESIPLEARIVALSDVLDALLSERPYKAAFSEDRALEILREGVGRHFDEEVHAAFEASLDEIRQIRTNFCDATQPTEISHESCAVCR